jgi:hypothetical protein
MDAISRPAGRFVEKQIKLRSDRGSIGVENGVNLLSELEITRLVSGALLKGIKTPKIKLDSLGFFVISGRPPRSQEVDDR